MLKEIIQRGERDREVVILDERRDSQWVTKGGIDGLRVQVKLWILDGGGTSHCKMSGEKEKMQEDADILMGLESHNGIVK